MLLDATRGFKLPARHVIHTVGPVYFQHPPEEAAQLLSACHKCGCMLLFDTMARSFHISACRR